MILPWKQRLEKSYQGATIHICVETIWKCISLSSIYNPLLGCCVLLSSFPIVLCFLLQAYIFRIEGNTLKIVAKTKGKKVRNVKNCKCFLGMSLLNEHNSDVCSCLQLGSYYGASVCAVDLNADGLSDLLVGAPMSSSVREEGCVHVYMNQGEVRHWRDIHFIIFWYIAMG